MPNNERYKRVCMAVHKSFMEVWSRLQSKVPLGTFPPRSSASSIECGANNSKGIVSSVGGRSGFPLLLSPALHASPSSNARAFRLLCSCRKHHHRRRSESLCGSSTDESEAEAAAAGASPLCEATHLEDHLHHEFEGEASREGWRRTSPG